MVKLAIGNSLHKKALLREEFLKNNIKEKDGKIKDLNNRLFGKKSEKKSTAQNEEKANSALDKIKESCIKYSVINGSTASR